MSGKISPGICQGFDFFLAPACAAQAEAPCCTLHVRKVFKNLEKPTQTSYFQELAWQPAQLVTMTAGTVRGLSGDSAVTEGDSG